MLVKWHRHQELNLDLDLRRVLFYPLDYAGMMVRSVRFELDTESLLRRLPLPLGYERMMRSVENVVVVW